jgi:SAM-dependent methyltransferase
VSFGASLSNVRDASLWGGAKTRMRRGSALLGRAALVSRELQSLLNHERMPIDFGRTAADYAAYRAGYPEELFTRLRSMGAAQRGQRVLDLGTGTGALARGFAHAGCVVTGLDLKPALLDQARRLDAIAGLTVTYLVGRAEDTSLETGSCDVVAAGQCWHWFDRVRAASEACRLLAPGGALVICHLDYLPLPGNVCSATEALVLRYNPGWMMAGGTGIHGEWTVEVAVAGFERIETFSFDVTIPFTHEAWRGRMRTCNAIGASLPDESVADFDRALANILAEEFPEEPIFVPHRTWALVARAPM